MMSQAQQRSWAPLSFKTRLLIYLFFFTLLSSLLFLRGRREVLTDHEWDVLIFTQHWPNTVCMTWEEKNPSNNSCRLPKEKDIWTIHGIWPTKLGTIGPLYCNSSYHFNATQLASIESNLTEYWIDVEVPQPANSFWKHEWLKHGTCCSALPNMSTELKYFKAGLEWLDKYNMKNVLDKAGLYPDTNTSTDLTTIWLGIKTGLGVNPSIHCIHDKKTGQYYLQEIRICFDKSLQLTDCDGIRSRRMFRWQPLGNCPNEKPIFYPSTIPPRSRKPLPPPPDNSVISLLKVIQFVMWLTS
uniref:Uncharacterized protein n=1 Tax=Homalodisca liturata TaxID=320908 RepID=A0A1B6I0C2_9HEMI